MTEKRDPAAQPVFVGFDLSPRDDVSVVVVKPRSCGKTVARALIRELGLEKRVVIL